MKLNARKTAATIAVASRGADSTNCGYFHQSVFTKPVRASTMLVTSDNPMKNRTTNAGAASLTANLMCQGSASGSRSSLRALLLLLNPPAADAQPLSAPSNARADWIHLRAAEEYSG